MHVRDGILSFTPHVCPTDNSEILLLGRLKNQTEEQKNSLARIFNEIIAIKKNVC